MTPTITAMQRFALYDQILSRISEIDDVRLALRQEDYDTGRLGGEYSDDLRLLVDDLGFGEGGEGPIELTSSPQILRRALVRHREIAERHAAGLRSELVEPRQEIEQDRLVCEACTAVLATLESAAVDA